MSSSGPPAPRPTIYDVAERAGVSKSLVSLVLQGSARVSEARRQSVQAAIAELGYRPSRAAAMLASRRTMTVGVVIDDFRNLWFVDLLRGLQSELSSHGYYVMVTDTLLNAHLGHNGAEALLSSRLDGLVLASEPPVEAIGQIPTVVAGWRTRLPARADLVANNDEVGGRLATDHLIALGHTRVGHLTGAGGAAARRLAGYRTCIRLAGLRPDVAGRRGGTSEEDGYTAATELFEHRPDLTAIFAANDTMALGALAAARSRGLIVPGDVSVVGYDNSPLASSRYLELTSVDDRSDAVGVHAGRALLARIDNPTGKPSRILLEPTLVVRSTTAPARRRT